MTLIDTGKMTMTLNGYPKPVPVIDENGDTVYQQTADNSEVVETILTIRCKGEVIWPNREGERFAIGAAHEKLKALNRQNTGISLCWPATASVQAVGVINNGAFHTIHANTDFLGRARFLEIKSEEPGHVSFRFKGSSVTWSLFSVQQIDSEQTRDSRESTASLYQLGLIGPEGECEVPADRGFSILGDAARTIIDKFGPPFPGDIIHIFGYAAGHDRGYPDYTPSPELGGKAVLKSAVEELRTLGFEVSFYLNARLAELSLIPSYPELENSVLTDVDGQRIIEVYRGREFAVMNPSSSDWINHLLSEADHLKALGASWVQLDQIAGRAAAVTPGEIWGKGYRKLIEDVRSMGLKVWIQGVSDYYPADAFEATWRAVNILEDGTLRGGFPLGEPDTTLIESLGFKKPLIVPERKYDSLKKSGLGVIHDRCAVDEELPIWGASWLNNLENMQLPRCGRHKKL